MEGQVEEIQVEEVQLEGAQLELVQEKETLGGLEGKEVPPVEATEGTVQEEVHKEVMEKDEILIN